MTEPFATHKDRIVISSQGEKFIQAARELKADKNEGRWEERLKKVAKQKLKPVPNPKTS